MSFFASSINEIRKTLNLTILCDFCEQFKIKLSRGEICVANCIPSCKWGKSGKKFRQKSELNRMNSIQFNNVLFQRFLIYLQL